MASGWAMRSRLCAWSMSRAGAVARVQQVTQLSLKALGQETRMEVDYSDRETVDGGCWTSNW